ncbi:serine protease [Novipirellula caenicola]|uniref:Uncharacterized protein n=1 Tax=Novipirellula caenicola TaxID=1536901 RepID=A0ABP9W412_9BACT
MTRVVWKDWIAKAALLIICLCCVLAGSSGIAQEAIPADRLDALKKATVYVRVETGRFGRTGSGFLMGKVGQWGYIVTNQHVVQQHGTSPRTVEVDFNSGSANRITMPAEVLSEDRSRDLAVLRIKNDNLPDPIKLISTNQIRETVPVFILGYPFGNALSTNQRGPSVTIGKGSISSIHTDDFGVIGQVQVDGDINPGNSGGPIVFADGSLMGVSVATVLGTQIGIGIPCESVLAMLDGRVGAMSIERKAKEDDRVELNFKANLIDPLGKLKRVSVFYIEAEKVKRLESNEDGTWSSIASNMVEVKLKISDQSATGSHVVRGDDGATVEYYQQIRFTNGKGKTFYTSPGKFQITFAEKADKKSDRKIVQGDRDADDWIGGAEKNDDAPQDKLGAAEMQQDDADDWISADIGNIAAGPNNQAQATNTPLADEPFTCVDATCRLLKFDASEMVNNMVWSTDHQHFFVLKQSGVLSKISFPGLVEVLRLDLASPCSWIEMSKEGLCVLVKATQDLIVLDEKTLKRKKKLAVGDAETFGASPQLSYAYFYGKDYVLSVADLSDGKVVNQYPLAAFNRPIRRIGDVNMPTVSPDGEYLFCESSECLHKLRIRGKTLTYLQGGPRIGSNAQRIEISDDSKYVAMPSGGGNGKGYSTYLYRVSDITNPILEVDSGAYPRALSLDKQARMIYAQDHATELKTMTSGGQLLKNYDLAPRSSGTTDFLVHPSGYNVIVFAAPHLFVVQLPRY